MHKLPALSEGEHTFESKGVALTYRVAGQGNEVFVAHSVGWGSPASYLRNGFGHHLEKDYTLVYVTPRGNGNSGRPQDENAMSSATMAEDIEELRKHLGLDSIPILFGHANGACIVLTYAERYPFRVAKLILVDAQVHDSPPNDSFQQWVAKRKDDAVFGPALAALTAAYKSPPTTDEEFAEILVKAGPYHFSDPLAASIYAQQCDLKETPARVWAFLRQSACDSKPENRLPHVADAGRVTAETLIIWGRDDPMCSLTAADALAHGIPGAKLVIFDDCGLIPWVEKPAEFLSSVRGFLNH
ncbi:alpha/beta-hydrolase [Curvularia clavata]|uniref:Alpha/beta-hydrolase n=1 Tax=Curvularia clavata TaxID=95742 RepID=A0A9Q8ZHL6_CURCL|nr:alpha/beta-hydrolase [Curvularia clavata]